MAVRNSTLYLVHKWMNITVGQIRILFVTVLWISVEPRNMGGHLSYFVEDPMIHLGHG